jgi:hypothetical protein
MYSEVENTYPPNALFLYFRNSVDLDIISPFDTHARVNINIT